MKILINVVNQKLKPTTNIKSFVSGTQEFIKFIFNLSEDWDNLLTFAQFQQNGVAYNQYLSESNSVYLPSEIEPGLCTLVLYGSHGDTIAVTNGFSFTIEENILTSDAQSTDISTSLYNQLVSMVNDKISGVFPTIEAMKSNNGLSEGDVVETSGFSTSGDGGGAKYKIVSNEIADDHFVHALSNGMYASLIIENNFINVLQLGAKNDGSEDVAPILETISLNSDCKNIYFPEGIYAVKPKVQNKFSNSSDSRLRYGQVGMLVDRNDMTIYGDGKFKSILKISDDTTDRYSTIIFVRYANRCTIRDIGFDQNPEECAILPEPTGGQSGDPDYDTGFPHNRNSHKLNCIQSGGILSDLVIKDCRFRHCGSQAIMVNSNVRKLIVENNEFSYAPVEKYQTMNAEDMRMTSGPAYDSSTVFTNGTDVTIRGNRFYSEATLDLYNTYVKYNGSSPIMTIDNIEEEPTGKVFLRPETAIENHARDALISGNHIFDYSTGIILAQDTEALCNTVVSENVMTDVRMGVSFWLSTSFVTPNITVRDNRITQTMKWYVKEAKNSTTYAHAISSNTGSVLKNIDIRGNTIAFDRSSMTQDALTYGLGSSAGFASMNTVELDGLVLTDNVFLDLPVYGVYIHQSSPSRTLAVTGATIRNNLFRNCGWCDALETSIATDAYKNNITRRAAIEISPDTLVSAEVQGNDIVDTSTGGECGEAILISDSNWVNSGKLLISRNTIRSLCQSGFSTGSVSMANMSQIIDGTSQFNLYNIVTDTPTNLVVKAGQVFTTGTKSWNCTTGGSYERSININSASMVVIPRTTGSVYTTILTASSETHGLRVGDTITVTYGGTSKTLTVLLVNGTKIYTTDWSATAIIAPVTVTVAINNQGVLVESAFNEPYTAGNGIDITGHVISLDSGSSYIGEFNIPGLIPDGVQKISQYTINGDTSVSNDEFVNAEGTITVGSQTISLPELAKWDMLTAQSTGAGVVIRSTSNEVKLKDLTWSFNANQSNETSLYFYNSADDEDLSDLGTHSDSVLPTDILCNVMDVKRVNDIFNSSVTAHGVAVGSANRIRIRVTRAEMLAAGVGSSELETVGGLVAWATAVDAAVIYEAQTPSTEVVSLTALTANSGAVALTGGYSGGTMTATEGNALADQIAALSDRISEIESRLPPEND